MMTPDSKRGYIHFWCMMTPDSKRGYIHFWCMMTPDSISDVKIRKLFLSITIDTSWFLSIIIGIELGKNNESGG